MPRGTDRTDERRIHPRLGIELYATVQLTRRRTSPARRALELVAASAALDGSTPRRRSWSTCSPSHGRSDARAIVLALDDAGRRRPVRRASARHRRRPRPPRGRRAAAVALRPLRALATAAARRARPGCRRNASAASTGSCCPSSDVLAPAWVWTRRPRVARARGSAARLRDRPRCGVETKSSAANEPQVVLDQRRAPARRPRAAQSRLVHLSLEVLRDGRRDPPRHRARSLRRSRPDGPAEDLLEDRLLAQRLLRRPRAALYHDGYALRRLSLFMRWPAASRESTEDGLPDGVGRVRYRLAIDACRDHEVQPIDVRRSSQGRHRCPH